MSASSRAEMSFLEHLTELRSCLIHMFCGIGLCAIAAFVWSSELFSLFSYPLNEAFKSASLIGTGPADAFIVKLKVALAAGAILSSPYSFYQVWRFIAPGLHDNERGLALPFVIAATLFFLVGVVFCFLIVFPFAFGFFEDQFVSIGVEPTIRIGEYLGFSIKLLLIFGLVFEMPVLTYFLAKLGLVTHKWLIRQARIAIIVIFILAAILTPPDIVTQLLLAGPLMVLYGLCIGIAYVVRGNGT